MRGRKRNHPCRQSIIFLLALLLTALCAFSVTAAETEGQTKETEPANTGKVSLSRTKIKITSTKRTSLRLENAVGAVAWKSSNPKVVRIWKTPKANVIRIKALKAGKAVVMAKAGDKTYSCKVQVVSKPRLSKKKKTLREGKSFKLGVALTVSKPAWSSDNPMIASVEKITNRTVRIVAHESGTTTIRAKVDGKQLACQVRVKRSNTNAISVPSGYTGWKKANGKTWYFVNGRQVRGWHQIGGNWYYFVYEGMKTNCIAGDSSGGWYYVNTDGMRVTDPQICLAVGFVRSCSGDNLSPMARLRLSFQRMCSYTYSWFPDSPGPSAFPSYAAHTFKAKIANCWRYGSAMAYVARVLGYDSRVSLGGVTAHGPTYPLSAHGWCEVNVGGVWKMIDVSMQKHHSEVSLFLVPRPNYPFRLQVNSTHPMTLRGTSVYWG